MKRTYSIQSNYLITREYYINLRHKQTKDGTSIKEVKIRLVQAEWAMTRLAMLWENKAISLQTNKLHKSLSCQYCSMDVRAGRWWRIWETNPRFWKQMISMDAWHYHRENTKQTIIYGNRSIFLPDERRFYCQLSSVASYHGSSTSAITIRCQKPYYKEQWIVVLTEEDPVNRGRTTSGNGQASPCRHCCTLQTIAVNRWPSQRRHLLDYSQRCLGVMGISEF